MSISSAIERINELAKKQRETGLTVPEKEEQAKLRRQYIDHIKAQVRTQLDQAVAAQQGHVHGPNCSCHHHQH